MPIHTLLHRILLWLVVFAVNPVKLKAQCTIFITGDSMLTCGERSQLRVSTNWSVLSTGITNDLYGLVFTTPQTGYTCGEGGTILKLTQGGDSIQVLSSGVTANLQKVYAKNIDTLFAIGSGATLLRTQNAGQTWTVISTPIGPAENFTGIFFVNAHTGFITASNGKLIKTSDGGGTWTEITTGFTNYIYDVFFTDSLTGYLGTSQYIFKTTNGGYTWNSVTTPQTVMNYTSLVFINDSVGFAGGGAGGGFVLKTTNAGTTWNQVWGDPYYMRLSKSADGKLLAYGKGVWFSEDMGVTWTPETTAPGSLFQNMLTFYGATLSNYDKGMVVGSGGKVYRHNILDSVRWSTQLGLSDSTIANPLVNPIITTNYQVSAKVRNCIAYKDITVFVDPIKVKGKSTYMLDCGDSVKFNVTSNTPSNVSYNYRWTPTRFLSSDTVANPFVKPNSHVFYKLTISSPNGCVDSFETQVSVGVDVFYKQTVTLRCGDTLQLKPDTGVWARQDIDSANFNIEEMQYLNSDTGFISGGASILKTTDGGRTWSSNLTNGQRYIRELFFVNNLVGYASCETMGAAEILKTTNGGASWTVQNLQSLTSGGGFGQSLQFLNEQVGYVIGSTTGSNMKILKTTNGGLLWSVINTSYYISALQFKTADTGFIAASSSGSNYLFKTTNGGNSWTPVTQALFDPVYGIQFITNQLGFAYGYGRKLWRTTDGGNSWVEVELGLSPPYIAILRKIHFYDSQHAFAVGLLTNPSGGTSSNGCLFQTDNAGLTWKRVAIDIEEELHDVYANSLGFALAVGHNGYMLRKLKSPQSITWLPEIAISQSQSFTPSLYPVTNRSYYYQANYGDCLLSDSVHVKVTPMTFNLEPTIAVVCGDSFSIRPTTTFLWIDASRYGSSWEVRNATGQIVLRSQRDSITKGNYDLLPGMYTLRIRPQVIPPPLYYLILPANGDTLTENILMNNPGDSIIERYFTVRDLSTFTFQVSPSPMRVHPTSVATKYQVSMSSPRGCVAKDSLLAEPVALKLNAGTDKMLICGSSVQLDTLRTNGKTSSFASVNWSHATQLNDSTSIAPFVSPINTTHFRAEVQTANGCTAIDTVTVSVAALTAEVHDTILGCNDSMRLSVISNYSGDQPLQYLWTPAVNISSDTASQPRIHAKKSMEYFVELTTWNGCKASDSMRVNLSKSPSPQLCIVSVTEDNKNQLVWDRSQMNQLDTFFVMKETNVTNQYTQIGSITSRSTYLFTDSFSQPYVQSNKYRLVAVDQCANRTDEGESHQTMHLTINKGTGNAWNLIWNKYDGFTVNTYNVYRGKNLNDLQLIGTSSGSNNSYTDLTPPEGDVFYQVEIVSNNTCNPGKNYNTSRSNKASNTMLRLSETFPQSSGIRIFPNPTYANITIELQTLQPDAQLEVYDMQGKMLQQQIVSDKHFVLDMSSYKAGLYVLRIVQEGTNLHSYVNKQ